MSNDKYLVPTSYNITSTTIDLDPNGWYHHMLIKTKNTSSS